MKILRKTLVLGLLFALLAFPFAIWWQAEALVDWWALKDYKPSAQISALARDTTMTENGRHIFFVNHPELVDNLPAFRQQCPLSEQTIVLGCYHSNQRGIDIYNVKDPRLSGIHEVTAAHELLHAAYDRLDNSEKQHINLLLRDFYANQLRDQRILDTVETYKGLEPEELVNEMHSIFGSEASDLPSELENYYKRYFNNRAAVVALAENYDSEFTNRTKAIEDYDHRLADLKNKIDLASQSLDKERLELLNQRRHLDSLRASGKFEEYNAGVANFNAQVDDYNSSINRLRRDINTYNALIEERNALAKELQSLDKAIDTRIIPQPVQ